MFDVAVSTGYYGSIWDAVDLNENKNVVKQQCTVDIL